MECICGVALDKGIKAVEKFLPNIKHLLAPIINAAFQKQSRDNLKLLTTNATSNIGCWNTFMFVNGTTADYHREDDCAYTFITIPKQTFEVSKAGNIQPTFLFQIDEEKVLSMSMTDNLTFFYNGSFVIHRQSYKPSVDDAKNKFYNVSSYANEKLFDHLRNSFDRLNK